MQHHVDLLVFDVVVLQHHIDELCLDLVVRVIRHRTTRVVDAADDRRGVRGSAPAHVVPLRDDLIAVLEAQLAHG